MNDLWLCESVGKFWQGVNWENQAKVNSTVASYHSMTVRQYFQTIPWHLTPVAVPDDRSTVAAKNGQTQASDTLADFLQDVSNFF